MIPSAIGELRQLSLFLTDDASGVQWVRQQLQRKRKQDYQTIVDVAAKLLKKVILEDEKMLTHHHDVATMRLGME